MQWSDVTKSPPPGTLRQFGGLCLVVFGGLGGWRLYRGESDAWAVGLLGAGLVIGALGLVQPRALRYLFTGWMIAAFPIGWAVSRIVLGILFFGVFTPVALLFRVGRRDALHRRRATRESYWSPKAGAGDVREYFRQF